MPQDGVNQSNYMILRSAMSPKLNDWCVMEGRIVGSLFGWVLPGLPKVDSLKSLQSCRGGEGVRNSLVEMVSWWIYSYGQSNGRIHLGRNSKTHWGKLAITNQLFRLKSWFVIASLPQLFLYRLQGDREVGGLMVSREKIHRKF